MKPHGIENCLQSAATHFTAATAVGEEGSEEKDSDSIASSTATIGACTNSASTSSSSDIQVDMEPSKDRSLSERPLTESPQIGSPNEWTKWEEAAVYAREGLDNDKFSHHPKNPASNHAYLILHHPVYYITHLFLSILLMLIALIEWPTVVCKDYTQYRKLLILVHGVAELTLLVLLSVDIVLRMLWLRIRAFVSFQHRTSYISIVLFAMFVEVLVLLIRQDTHVRVLRALRPVFFIDNHLMSGVRRLLQEIFRCLKAITDIFLFLLLLIAFFAIIGYYLFSPVDDSYFETYGQSFVSMFVLLTTANYPDIMMRSYHAMPGSPIFFVCYLTVTAYVISNVLLGVVYSNFRDVEKKKSKQLFLHKREALQLAYGVLAGPNGIKLCDFILFMKEFQPHLSDLHLFCVFKALKARADIVSLSCSQEHNKSVSNEANITLEEFYALYRTIRLKWKQIDNRQSRLSRLIPSCAKKVIKGLVVTSNFVFFVAYLMSVNSRDSTETPLEQSTEVLIISNLFLGFYCFEIFLRVVGFGIQDYFRRPWNILLGQVAEHPTLSFAICFRPLRLLRILRLKHRFKDILNALAVLSPQLVSVALLLVVIYYVFAIIGMESFHGRVFPGCCNESWYGAGSYYSDAQNATTSNVYWLNNFDSILHSYVTLFELMILNNWYIIMEGFAQGYGFKGTVIRLYFMLFFTVTLVTTTIIIAYVVEAFTFKFALTSVKIKILRTCKRYHNPKCTHNCVEVAEMKNECKEQVTIKLTKEDTALFAEGMDAAREHTRKRSLTRMYSITGVPRGKSTKPCEGEFIGSCVRSKEDLNLLRYLKEIPAWIADYEKQNCQNHSDVSSECTDNKGFVEKLERIFEKLRTRLFDFVDYILT